MKLSLIQFFQWAVWDDSVGEFVSCLRAVSVSIVLLITCARL
jgi:hypothetical protein